MKTIHSSILLVVVVALGTSYAQDTKRDYASIIEELTSESRGSRLGAAERLRHVRRDVAEPLAETLRRLSASPDRKYQGPFHLAVEVAGNWRLEETVPLLVPYVGLALDRSSFPVGRRRRASSYYPVAQALARIGGKKVVGEMFERLSVETDDQVRRACAWVLKEHLGAEEAVALTHQRIATASKKERNGLVGGVELLSALVILRIPE